MSIIISISLTGRRAINGRPVKEKEQMPSCESIVQDEPGVGSCHLNACPVGLGNELVKALLSSKSRLWNLVTNHIRILTLLDF